MLLVTPIRPVIASNTIDSVQVYSNINTIFPFYEQTKVHLSRTDPLISLSSASITSIYMKDVRTGARYRVSISRSTNTYTLKKPSSFREGRLYELQVTVYYKGRSAVRKISFDSYTIRKVMKSYPKYVQLPLSCEATSLRIALATKGVTTTEAELMTYIGYDEPLQKKCSDDSPVLTQPTDNAGNKKYYCATGDLIWGNPHFGFVGDINGTMLGTGWGVYSEPVTVAAKHFRPLSYDATGTYPGTLLEVVRSGEPILIWSQSQATTLLRGYSWKDSRGNTIDGLWNHVRVTVGYAFNRKTKVITNIYVYNPSRISPGLETWTQGTFYTQLRSMGSMSVVVK